MDASKFDTALGEFFTSQLYAFKKLWILARKCHWLIVELSSTILRTGEVQDVLNFPAAFPPEVLCGSASISLSRGKTIPGFLTNCEMKNLHLRDRLRSALISVAHVVIGAWIGLRETKQQHM
jgi:hypothetical protein